MRPVAVLALLVATLLTPAAARADYLNTPEALAPALAAALARAPEGHELRMVEVGRRQILILTRSGDGTLSLVTMRPSETALVSGDVLQGPNALASAGGVPDHGFALSEAPTPDRAAALVAAGVAHAGPGAQATVLWLRRTAAADEPPGALSVIVQVESPQHAGQVHLGAKGTVERADLWPNNRPLDVVPPLRDPATAAAAALAPEIGPDPAVWRVRVLNTQVTAVVTDPAEARNQLEITWISGRTGDRIRRDGSSRRNRDAEAGIQPFALAEARLADLPALVRAAQAAAGPDAGAPHEAEATPGAGAGAAPVWTVNLRPEGAVGRDGDTTVTIRPDGTVVRVLLPAALRPPYRGDSGVDLVAALAAFAEALGPEARIWEIDARPDRVTVQYPHPDRPQSALSLTLTPTGLRPGPERPAMMQTANDLFPLAALAGLVPEAVEVARAAGVAAVAHPGGAPERLRIWSGAPFWRHPAGEPFFDIRVGVPPQGHPSGYAVVTLGGEVVQAYR